MTETGQKKLLQGLATAIGAGAVAYFALWACAPVMVARPPVPATDLRNEVGVGGYGEVLSSDKSSGQGATHGGGATVWAQRRFGGLELGASAFVGSLNALGGGGFLRFTGPLTDSLRLGVDAELGWLYAAVGMPVSYRVSPEVYLWSRPALFATVSGNSSSSSTPDSSGIQVPLGVSAVPTDWLVLSFEVDGLFRSLAAASNGSSSSEHPSGLVGGLSAALRF